MNTVLEIERKFLVKRLPHNLESLPCEKIVQGYLSGANDPLEIRLRQKGELFFQTLKQGTGLTRKEIEIELSEEQFNALWPAVEKRCLEKLRYSLPYQEHLIELDIFQGSLKNLFIAEVEFPDITRSELFQPPDWFGEEVTKDERYKNKYLVHHGRPA